MSKTPTLYHYNQSRSARVAWLVYELENLGYTEVCDVKLVDLTKGETKTKEFLKINPFGTLPTYIDENGELILESAGIILSMGEKYKDSKLFPESYKFYQWIVYGILNLSFSCINIRSFIRILISSIKIYSRR